MSQIRNNTGEKKVWFIVFMALQLFGIICNSSKQLIEWLERLTVNAEVATVHKLNNSILRHSGIWGAADEAVTNAIKNHKYSLLSN